MPTVNELRSHFGTLGRGLDGALFGPRGREIVEGLFAFPSIIKQDGHRCTVFRKPVSTQIGL